MFFGYECLFIKRSVVALELNDKKDTPVHSQCGNTIMELFKYQKQKMVESSIK